MPTIAPPLPTTTPDNDTKPKLLPPYAVVVYNDDYHTFEYVVTGFQKVFGYSFQKCYQLAIMIHHGGQAVVWTGSKEVAELKKDQIESLGPDPAALVPVTWPLQVALEPMA